MGYSTLSQILLIIISITIIFTYIQPTFADISVIQDELFQYSDAVAKAEEFNASMQSLLSTERSLTAQNMAALDVFLPANIDTPQVMRDIESMVDQSNITLENISAEEVTAPIEGVVFEGEEVKTSSLVFQDFEVDIVGSYEDVKNFLRVVEQNTYVLEVVKFDLGDTKTAANSQSANTSETLTDDVSVKMTLRAFTLGSNQSNKN